MPAALTLVPLNPTPSSVGTNTTDDTLKVWTLAECYEPSGTITRNGNEVATSFAVVWPDGTGGAFTATTLNSSNGAVDAYTVTHASTSKTVTQAAVTRDASGAVTSKPALVVS